MTHPQTLQDATLVTRELMQLIGEENIALRQRDISLVHDRIKDKNRLAIKLEKLIQNAKQQATAPMDDQTRAMARALQAEMAVFRTEARKNALLLQSAHQVRADTLKVIRQTVADLKPKASTYNSTGAVSEKSQNPNLLNKTI